MGRSDPGLTTSTSEADISNQSRMKGSLSLVLFGLLVLIALSAVRADEEEGNSLSEELAEARVARSPDAKRRRKGKKGKKTKKARRGRKRNNKRNQKKKDKSRTQNSQAPGRKNRLQRKKEARATGLNDF